MSDPSTLDYSECTEEEFRAFLKHVEQRWVAAAKKRAEIEAERAAAGGESSQKQQVQHGGYLEAWYRWMGTQ